MLTEATLRSATIAAWMAEVGAAVRAQRDQLTQLDAAIGDGDHGTNMVRGFDAVEQALAGRGEERPGRVLITCGKTLVATVGGASGPLWGSALAVRAGRSATRRRSTAPSSPRRSTRRWRRSRSSAPPRSATRRSSTPSTPRPPRCGPRSAPVSRWRSPWRRRRGRRGGRPRDRAAAGAQGPRLVSRRAVDRPPGPGSDLHGADHARAGTRRLAGD